MNCQTTFYNIVLNIINTVLSLLGVGLIALSVYELNISTPGTFEHIAVIIQIFIGSFLILTSFLGCFGACRESLGLIWSYGLCVVFLLTFQIYILVVAHTTDYKRNATDDLIKLWQNYPVNVERIAEVEQNYYCCGKNSTQDYISMGKFIPTSCYQNYERIDSKRYTKSCLEAVQENAAKSAHIGSSVKWTLFLFEVLALGIASLLGINLRNERRRRLFEN
uniref:Tetraspanin n=1 Tax=Glossina morsitans morsitans TaxID=37546 RepID=A0A1B0FIP9_GLOMM